MQSTNGEPTLEQLRGMTVLQPDYERPALECVDRIAVRLASAGLYHFYYGNERSWFLPLRMAHKLDFRDQQGNALADHLVVPLRYD